MTEPTIQSPLLQDALRDAILLEAWHKVRQNDGAPGVDNQRIEDFAENALSNLGALRQDLLGGNYHPAPLLRVWMDRPNKKPRPLAIPTVRDRIMQSAVSLIMTPILDQRFADCSFAYRPAHSLQMALERIVQCRDQGFVWVVDADIFSFFEQIPHLDLLHKLQDTFRDHEITQLVARWLCVPVQEDGNIEHPRQGIPQGSPLSPLLANLYLDQLDQALLAKDYRVVRYADDFIILCKERSEAEAALHLSEDLLHFLHLRLQPEKTRITNFAAGFHFLGAEFLGDTVHSETVNLGLLETLEPTPDKPQTNTKVIPNTATHESRPAPSSGQSATAPGKVVKTAPRSSRHSLYVVEQGALLGLRSGRIVVRHQGEDKQSLPIHRIDQVHLLGNQLLSTALLRACRDQAIDVFISDFTGSCDLRMDDLRGSGLELIAAQFQAQENGQLLLQTARQIVHGKIANSRAVLRKANQRRQDEGVGALDDPLRHLQGAALDNASVEGLRGIEGTAAKLYYQGFAKLIGQRWQWPGRVRRPPQDPVNALLSYGYGMLYRTVLATLHSVGLNPYLGVYHLPRPGHPALASDLMEEFRAPIIDRMVLNLLLDATVQESDFEIRPESNHACHIQNELRKRMIQSYEDRLNGSIKNPLNGADTDYRGIIRFQAQYLADLFRSKVSQYQAFTIR